jgi:integrase
MAVSVQQRGDRFQLRVTHRLLPRPFFFTFPREDEARAYGNQLARLLDAGVVPQELLAKPARGDDPLVVEVLRAYLNTAAHLTPSDDALLSTMLPELAGLRVSGITYAWADAYIRGLKVGRGLTPGSIRKRVGALARVLDWHIARTGAGTNALRALPSGYSQYTASDVAAGAARREDQARDRRLHPGEEARIRAAMDGDLALLFDVILATGLRLREAYRLRVDQVDLARRVLRVEGSKAARGRRKPRTVPMTPGLQALLAARVRDRVGLIFPFWSGEPADLDPATHRLSFAFAAAFRQAGVADLTEHDLRHEAACRWFEMRHADGRWVFSDVEVCRIMGWSSLAMALRYASLRGEDLAARMDPAPAVSAAGGPAAA